MKTYHVVAKALVGMTIQVDDDVQIQILDIASHKMDIDYIDKVEVVNIVEVEG